MSKNLIAICLVVVMCLSGCSETGKKSDGVFKVVDGKEVFVNGENQVIDKLVTFEGEQYYIGEDGTKVKNNWAIIDNDGQYAYFGAKGIMIKDQIKDIGGNLYLFDENGMLVTSGLTEYKDNEYYATKDGYLLKNQFKIIDNKDYYFQADGRYTVASPSWVNNINTNGLGDLQSGYYYLDEKGQRVKNTWQEGYYLNDTGLMATDTWIGSGENKVYVGTDGKKQTDYKEVVNLVKDILGNNVSNNKSNVTGTWQLTNYVDSFNDYTEEKYIAGFLSGTYTNSISKNNDCDFKFLIGKDYVDLMIWQYGNYQVKNQNLNFDITAKENNGNIVNFTARLKDDSDRLYFDEIGSAYVINCLKNGMSIKLLLESEYSNSYILEVPADNFATLYAGL